MGLRLCSIPVQPASCSAATNVSPWLREGRKPSICLCMIARDEEDSLERCVRPVLVAVDEFILVDTGSVDATVAIAESLGARVIHRNWEQDFSAARNASIAEAKADWILCLDADEVVDPESVLQIVKAAQDASALAVSFTFFNVDDVARDSPVLTVRMFRNLPGISFQNRIHEQILPSLIRANKNTQLRTVQAPVTVIHHGYTEEMMTKRAKRERNLALFALQLEEHPDDIFSHYRYADFLRGIEGHGDELIAVLESGIALLDHESPRAVRDMPYAAELHAILGLELLTGEDIDASKAVLSEGLLRTTPTPNLHYVAGCVATKRGEYAFAKQQFEHCLQFAGQVLSVPVEAGVTSWIACEGIGTCLAAMGKFDDAEEMFEESIRLNPEVQAGYISLAKIQHFRGKHTQAMTTISNSILHTGSSVEARLHGAAFLAEIGLRKDAAAS